MKAYVALDIEATSPNPEEAEIVEIAVQDDGGEARRWYLSTRDPLRPEHPVFRLTGIPFAEYEREKLPPQRALQELLDFLDGRPLLGHNLLRYDLPVLQKALNLAGIEFPLRSMQALDTLRLAHMVFPVPPEGLSGYRLGDMHFYFTGKPIQDAHRAHADVEATWKILAGLVLEKLPDGLARAWRELGLSEGELFPETQGQVKELLATPALVEPVSYEGKRFPHPSALGADLLPSRRPAQEKMFGEVERALKEGRRTLLEAPTGTGKTKGYLYPVLHLGERTWVVTHTKVLQAQALEELKYVGKKGYEVKAALVKSPKDTLCPEALFELFLDARQEEDEEVRVATGMLLHYAALGHHDLEALPAYWHFSRGFREVRNRVGTNPRRCRVDCPFFHNCAYQRILDHRKEAQVLVANQAYLMTHFLGQEEVPGEDPESGTHLVLDEAHHLEDTATEALTLVLDHEELEHVINRLARADRGLLKDGRRLEELSLEEKNKAKEVVENLLPRLREALANYTTYFINFLKRRGSGDPRYGLTLELTDSWKRLEEWPRIDRGERALLSVLAELKEALKVLSQAERTLMARDLVPIREYLQRALDLLFERRKALGLLKGEPNSNLLHLSEWDPTTGSWRHLAQPIDVSQDLQTRLWPRFRSAVLTSATLSVATESDPEGFGLLKRALGLEEADHHRLPPSLPYDKAHLVVPRHLPEARESTLPRFQRMLHEELRVLLPRAHRSLSLFTSLRRLQDAKDALEDLPELLAPLTRKEREDVASLVKQDPEAPVAALGSRSYMEGVDFPALKLVNLERIPFPLPSPLLNRRMQHAYEQGLDKWWDYYLPKAVLAFAQAFGRLIRDHREGVGDGAFVLWDKKLLNGAYQGLFYRSLPPGVHRYFPEDRKSFYDLLANILGIDRKDLPEEELEEEALRRLKTILEADSDPLERARRIAEEVYQLLIDEYRWRKQAEAIQAALEGRDLIALLPTGFGKSLAFQLPALLQGGLTLVVSPLVALMKDQADRLLEMGLPVGAIHSLMSLGEQTGVLDEVRAGRVWLLYVSPERLNRSETLWKLLQEKHATGELRRVVFDEAHCLVEWGFDFRPDYLKALKKLESLEGVPKSFFTATLTPKDLEKLKKVAMLQDPVLVKPKSFHRPNLHFVVRKAHGEGGKFQLLAKALLWLIETAKHNGEGNEQGSAIIYTSTRAEAERLAWALGRLFPELRVEAYHAGMGPLPRREAQERFTSGETKVMVATTAFGMGIDKPDIRLVVHWRPPRSIEEYVQQTGRAGRDGKPAYCLLLFTKGDWGFLEWVAGVSHGGESERRFVEGLVDLLEQGRPIIGYRQEVYEKIYQRIVEKSDSEEMEEEPFAGNDEDEEEENESPVSTLREIGQENFERLLASLERADVLEYEYLPGKVLLQCPKELLEGQLLEEDMVLLDRAGYRGSERGDELDLSLIPEEKARKLDDRLYELFREGRIPLYHYREPLLRVQAGVRLKEGYFDWDKEQRSLREQAKKRLQDVRAYAEKGRCRAQVLLKHLGETGGTCQVCDICAQDPGPWEQLEEPTEEELDRSYRPMETLLGFFAWVEEIWTKEARYAYLGKTSTLMALRGKDRGKSGVLSRKYTDNRFFGHLFFIKKKELEQTFAEALKKGYIEQKDAYEGSPLYGLTDKGRAYYRRGRLQEKRNGRS
ncbi:RecQ family ATP-dependent DNA helicase [Thermus oshimai]